MPLISIAGRRVHVQEIGRGPTVVTLHGLIWSDLSSMYLSIAPRLAGRRRIVMYDLRGHGRSGPARRGYDLDTLTEDLRDLLDQVVPEGEPVDLVGHSYGGTIALKAAMRPIRRIRRLVAIDAPVPPFALTEGSGVFRLTSDRAEREVEGAFETFGGDVSERLGWDETGRRVERWTERIGRFRSRTTLAEDLRREPTWSREELASIDVPVLLILAAQSSLRAGGEALARKIPEARTTVLPGNHFLHLARPAEIAREVERFLDE